MNNQALVYVLLRLAIAASMLSHGLVRLPKLAVFSQWMVGQFEKSMLPKALVLPFSYALPLLEFSVGILLVLGLFTKQALVAGSLIMVALLFGSGMIEEWSAMPSQLLHALFFGLLLTYLSFNFYSVDTLMGK